MNLKNKKRLAAKILNAGLNSVVFDSEKLNEIKEAITNEDIRSLIKDGSIKLKERRGVSRFRARKRLAQKRKGRRQGKGSRKGKRTSRLRDKLSWINKIRSQRKYMKMLRDHGYISRKDFRTIYNKAGGGFFRSKKHVEIYLEENKLVKKNGSAKKKKGIQN